MPTHFLENFFVFFLLELIQLGFLLLFSRVKHLRTTPLMAWLKSSVFALFILLFLSAEIYDASEVRWIFLFWLGQIPLSFMWWSTLQWGGSLTILRALGSNSFPIDIHEWKQVTSFGDKANDLKTNRLKLLTVLRLIRSNNESYQLTTLGRFLNYSFKFLSVKGKLR
jgi:hypothetical protein